MARVRVLGIGGSLRDDSRTRYALETALAGSDESGAEIQLFDLKEHALPLYDDRKEIETYPENVFRLLNAVRQSNGLILATPVYHGTLSGSMKNALDFLELLACDQPPWLTGKVTGLIAVAGGNSGANAINGLLHACAALRSWVLPTTAVIPGDHFDSDGKIKDQKLIDRLKNLGRDVGTSALKFAQVH